MKAKLFTDFDSCIVDSVKSFCNTYNVLYKDYPNFKPADHTKNRHWNFEIECPLINNPLDIFANSIFFKNLEFMDNTEEVIMELCDKYQVIICSLGCFENISLKSLYIKEKMPYIKDAVLLTNNGIKMDKSIVNMNYKGAIFLDDVESNLDSSNSKRKICFGKKFSWNEEWMGEWCKDWGEVGERLL